MNNGNRRFGGVGATNLGIMLAKRQVFCIAKNLWIGRLGGGIDLKFGVYAGETPSFRFAFGIGATVWRTTGKTPSFRERKLVDWAFGWDWSYEFGINLQIWVRVSK